MYQSTQLDPIIRLFILAGLLVVGFMACGLALSLYRNAIFQQDLERMSDRNRELAADIQQGFSDLQYYKSNQYKDKYAKENLGLQREGERVIILTEQQEGFGLPRQSDEEIAKQKEAAFMELVAQMPVIEHWRLYLFNQERIEELRSSL